MNKTRGFTLIELMIVIAIIGIFVSMMVPIIKSQIQSKETVEVIQLQQKDKSGNQFAREAK